MEARLRLWLERARAWWEGGKLPLRVRAELERSPRLHYGILAILGIVLLSLWFAQGDQDLAIRREVSAESAQLASLARLAGQTDWPERRDAALRTRAQLETRLWEADTDGLAQAALQDWLASQAKLAGLERVDIHVEMVNEAATAPASAAGLRHMAASVSAVFQNGGVDRFLAALQTYERAMIVDRLDLATRPLPRMDLALSAYLRPPGSRPARPEPAPAAARPGGILPSPGPLPAGRPPPILGPAPTNPAPPSLMPATPQPTPQRVGPTQPGPGEVTPLLGPPQ